MSKAIVNITRAFLFLVFLGTSTALFSQQDSWFYLRAKDTLIHPNFEKVEGVLTYTGNDPVLKKILKKYTTTIFKKTYRNANRYNLKKTFFVRTNSDSLMYDLLEDAGHLFVWGELVSAEDKKIYEPNDYGLTSTIGENIGSQVNLDYLDFLGVPKAWYYTTGNRDIAIGISDGYVDTLDIEFKGKIRTFRKSGFNRGHGMSVAETAAGQGDNGYGIAGVCYDCSVYATNFSSFKTYDHLLELSEAGAKVINCSWGLTRSYDTAQDAVYKMLEMGTVIVGVGHNPSLMFTKGEKYYYPASYDKVIGISSGMHRYESYKENILQTENKKWGTLNYARNIRWHVGANLGFQNNDTLRPPNEIYLRSVKNMNSEIDLLGPSIGIFRYSELYKHDEEDMSEGSQTSGVAPLVTGTIGLMFSLYPCLDATEVESILKMTSTNLDFIELNRPYKGLYGSGMLHTGRAVEMVYKLYAERETAYIENQDFQRWDFKITSLSEALHIRNQKFTASATLDATAKNRIVIGVNTVLKPNRNGKITLKIDPDLEKECDLVLRDPSIQDK